MSKAMVSSLIGQEHALDALTELVREGARRIIAQALEAEAQELIATISRSLPDGRSGIVRNGYLPERDILTGTGPVTVRVPKVRDRLGKGITFTSKLVPPQLKRAGRVEEFLPLPYLRDVSTGDCSEALAALPGPGVEGLSANTIGRLKQGWQNEHRALGAHPDLDPGGVNLCDGAVADGQGVRMRLPGDASWPWPSS